MKLVNTIIEDDIVTTWQKEDGTYEVYRYNFFGHPDGDVDYAVKTPKLPEWVLSMSKSFADNSNVGIVQITEFTENDFKYLFDKYKDRHPNPLVEEAIQAAHQPEHWLNNYIRDFISDAG